LLSVCRQSGAFAGRAHLDLVHSAIAIRTGAHEAVAELGIDFVGGERAVLIGLDCVVVRRPKNWKPRKAQRGQ